MECFAKPNIKTIYNYFLAQFIHFCKEKIREIMHPQTLSWKEDKSNIFFKIPTYNCKPTLKKTRFTS